MLAINLDTGGAEHVFSFLLFIVSVLLTTRPSTPDTFSLASRSLAATASHPQSGVWPESLGVLRPCAGRRRGVVA